ncbi:hypothetical protein PQX77_022158 [Marasmius sp. AFHP31]|nr:hypothetical protein PQX77_022158 [Marasmius sp. AFHP31]
MVQIHACSLRGSRIPCLLASQAYGWYSAVIDALDFAQVLQDITTTEFSATQPSVEQWPSQRRQINDDKFDALLASFTAHLVYPTQFNGDNTFEQILAQGFDLGNDMLIDPTFFDNPEGPFLHSIGESAVSELGYGDHSFLLPLPPSPTSSGLNSLPPSSPYSSFSMPDDNQFDTSTQAGPSTSQQDSQAQEDRFQWYMGYGPSREVGCTVSEDNILAEGIQGKRKPVSSHTVVPLAVPMVSKKPPSSRKPPSKRQKL